MLLLPVIVFCFGVVSGNVINKPEFVTACASTQPDFDDCTRTAFQGVVAFLKDGNAEGGIPPLDPMKLSEIKLFEGGNGPVSGNASFQDVRIVGLSKMKVISNKIDKDKLNLVTNLYIPELRAEGRFKVKGRILLLPIEGNGDGWLEPGNMTIIAKTHVEITEKEGQKFFNVTNIRIDFSIGKLKVKMNNLFKGQRQLEDNINAYVNDNWKVVYESLKPVISKTIEDITQRILQRFASTIPATYLVSDI